MLFVKVEKMGYKWVYGIPTLYGLEVCFKIDLLILEFQFAPDILAHGLDRFQ